MMLEIQLAHGTVWINPYHVTSIEPASLSDKVQGSYIQMQTGSGWNTPYQPYALAAKIADCKKQFGAAN